MNASKSAPIVLVLVTSALVARTAASQPAQPAQPAVQPDILIPAVAPIVGATTDRTSADTWQLGLDIAYTLFDDGDATGVHFDLFGHYLAPLPTSAIGGRSAVGGYGVLPIASVQGEGEDFTEIGNLELGGVFATQLAPGASLLFRLGIVLPTTDDGFDTFLVNILTGTGRITDTFTQIPEVTTIRLAASPTYRTGQFVGRLDVGLDIPNESDSASIGSLDIDAFVRFNLAAGIDLGTAMVTAELANLLFLGTESDDDDALHTLGFTAQYLGHGVRPYMALVLPLDEEFRQDIDLVLSVGVRMGR